jgi:3-phenylpropionate/cinnamic acid dioxygenase small subunit
MPSPDFDKYGPHTTTYTERTIRNGQPRDYADHERVVQVEVTETDQHGTTRPHSWVRYVDVDNVGRDQLVDRVRYLVAGHTPDRKPGPLTMSEHFTSYVDYAHVVGDGLIEVRIVDPFAD